MVRLLLRATPLAIILALVFGAAPAFAHEHVIVGDYEFTVGWLVEPAIAGQMNGLELFVAPTPSGSGAEHEGEGVPGLEDSLIFTLEYGGEARTLPLEPEGGRLGGYRASFLPSQSGQYTFHFTGSIVDQSVDAQVEPEEVADAGDVSFPAASTTASLANQLATVRILALAGALLGAAGVVLGLTIRRRS